MNNKARITFLLTCTIFLADASFAGVPGWATSSFPTKVDVDTCRRDAARAVKSVTGKAPTSTKRNSYHWDIRGFTSTEGIFVTCTARPSKICGKRKGLLSITVFSDKGSRNAVKRRKAVRKKFGDPIFIDCGPQLNPV